LFRIYPELHGVVGEKVIKQLCYIRKGNVVEVWQGPSEQAGASAAPGNLRPLSPFLLTGSRILYASEHKLRAELVLPVSLCNCTIRISYSLLYLHGCWALSDLVLLTSDVSCTGTLNESYRCYERRL